MNYRDDHSLQMEDANGEDSGDRASNPSWRRGARATTHIYMGNKALICTCPASPTRPIHPFKTSTP